MKFVKRAQPDWQGQRGGGVEADLVCQSFGYTLLQWHVWLSWHLLCQGPFGQLQVMGDKWRNCRDDCEGQGSAAVDINLLTIRSLLILSVPRSVLLKIDQLEFTPLESYKIKNSGWYGENRWLWLFLSSVINVMSIRNNKFIFNFDCLL